MNFGKWRGVPLACFFTAVLGWASTGTCQAQDPFHSIPREVMAYDYTTGGPYYAPPVPYGHYAKDPGAAFAKAMGCVSCKLHGLCPLGGCGMMHHCGDGKCGHGLGGHGGGCGGHGDGGYVSDGHAMGGHGHGGKGLFGGHGLFGHGHKGGIVEPMGQQVMATGQVVQPTAQVIPSAQGNCGVGGCGLKNIHSHLGKIRCGLCKGRGTGCGLCGGLGMAEGCGGCGGRGCDGCGGLGCHGLGSGCGGLCGKFAGLGAKAHGMLGGMFAHKQKIEYFVGPGGPVPITPGYVPYIVPTRSPRDFFSFPPMNPNDP